MVGHPAGVPQNCKVGEEAHTFGDRSVRRGEFEEGGKETREEEGPPFPNAQALGGEAGAGRGMPSAS